MKETSAVPRPAARRRRTAITTAAALSAVGIAGGVAFGVGTAPGTAPSAGAGSAVDYQPAVNGSGDPGGHGVGDGAVGRGGYGGGSNAPASTATSVQQAGIVDITSVLGYQNAQAAGTGMVLTSNGEVLTNNHVIAGATSITVTVVSTGAAYSATVVGSDSSADVAVLSLDNAFGLMTANLGTAPASLGEAVTAVGNAGGTGTLTAASGTVIALGQSITATDSTGGNAEQLSGLIETNAAVQPGDSGGPLYDVSTGRIVGMDTAASSGGVVQAYAIPILTAEQIATQIEQGVTSTTIQQGYPAFLGVSVTDAQGGATVLGVVADGPAAQAGVTAGDVITAVAGRPVASATDLTTALADHSPGQQVTVTWADATGGSHSSTVSLGVGPAQ